MTTPPPPDAASALGFTAEDMAMLQAQIAAEVGSQRAERMVPWLEWTNNAPLSDAAADARDKALIEKGLKPISEARLATRRMTDFQLSELGRKLADAHLISPDDVGDRMTIEAVWDKLTDYAADWHQANPDSRLSPEDMIDIYAGRAEDGKVGKTETDIITKVSTMTNEQAWGMLRDVMRNELGRNPDDAEVDAFQAAINEAQSRSPHVTTSTSTTDLAGNRTVNSVETGGIDVQGFTEEYAQGGENEAEYRAYQGATTYANAFMQAIKSPV